MWPAFCKIKQARIKNLVPNGTFLMKAVPVWCKPQDPGLNFHEVLSRKFRDFAPRLHSCTSLWKRGSRAWGAPAHLSQSLGAHSRRRVLHHACRLRVRSHAAAASTRVSGA